MGMISNPELVAAVSEACGFGLLATIATRECVAHDAYKQAILVAGEQGTGLVDLGRFQLRCLRTPLVERLLRDTTPAGEGCPDDPPAVDGDTKDHQFTGQGVDGRAAIPIECQIVVADVRRPTPSAIPARTLFVVPVGEK
jgi:NAD(P)H-dependent flavin oxidoreductase YrpB (nitropropane dioxygenase family)